MVKDKDNNNNSSNSLVFGRWPQTKTNTVNFETQLNQGTPKRQGARRATVPRKMSKMLVLEENA